jgi:hypothetical protein
VGGAERHVGVAGEVAVDADREGEHADPDRGAAEVREVCPLRENGIAVGRHVVGDDDLLAQSEREARESRRDVVEAMLPQLGNLVGDLPEPHDRARDELRKHRHVDGEGDRVARRLALAPVDVHRVGDVVEGVERDRDRQRQLDDREVSAQQTREPGQGLRREPRVLPDRQHRDVEHDHADEQPLAAPRVQVPLIGLQRRPGEEVDGHHGQQQQRVRTGAAGVEDHAAQRDDAVAPAPRADQDREQDGRHEVPQKQW